MQETDTTPEIPTRRRRGRILLIAIAVIALLVLALVPPYISVNRLQRRIAASISRSLGRTAHIDDVTLNLLPWPGFTLKNLVIDDDPAFSHEPIIRANVVTARLRLSSLWRRQVEFSTISFDTDEFGTGPSVNLVRNDAGQWNLEAILVQAARVDAAPTTQPTAGPQPRFPLIEAAKGARINIKRGPEKLPFALTDAEFQLSLNNPQQWHIHIEGHPARTDIHTNTSEPGLLSVDGTLNRAASFQDVPINLTAAWEKAPLGEATLVLTGSDAGWRGGLDLTAAITGTLGNVLLDARARITGLHRNDFAPSHALSLDLRCTAATSLVTRSLNDIKCLLPLDSTGRQVLLTGSVPDVHNLAAARWDLAVSRAPATWCLDWARLFSQRIPLELAPAGDVTGSLAYNGSLWSGVFHSDLTQPGPGDGPLALTADLQLGPPPAAAQSDLSAKRSLKSSSTSRKLGPGPSTSGPDWLASPPANTLILLPSTLHLDKTAQTTLDAAFTTQGYRFHLTGNTAPSRLLVFNQLLPPAADTLAVLFPTPPPDTPERLDLTCSRDWSAATQTCASVTTPAKPAPRRHRR